MWVAAISAWGEQLRLTGYPPTTIRTRTQHLRQLSTECATSPWQHTTGSLLRWEGNHGWSAESRHAARSSLRSFYHWALIEGLTSTDPTVGLPRVRRSRPIPHPAPDRIYGAALVAADERVKLMLRLGAEVGLRRGEIAQIHIDDIRDDLLGWSLCVHGKGDKERLVPLPDLLTLEMFSFSGAAGWLFPGHQNGHLAPQRVGDLVSAVLPPGWSSHSLRHRFGTRAFAVDRDLMTVRDLLGHSSVATTQIYVETPMTDARRTVLAVSSGWPP